MTEEQKANYGGKCHGGPYNGKLWAYPKKTMSVVWIEGNPLTEICFKREGYYEFHHDAWWWNGPTPTQSLTSHKHL